ncbi:MAG: hypothetical protein EAZ08_02470 [Cytophagales bacterium]|nr:MAG: hypothetical protein EAZ08_02470 [Cytophagales bacterium]
MQTGITYIYAIVEQDSIMNRLFKASALMRELNETVLDKDYGKGVSLYLMVGKLCQPRLDHITEDEDTFDGRKDVVDYRKIKKEFTYYPALIVYQKDYDFLMTCSDEEWLHLIAQKFLEGISKIEENNIKNFDTKQFYQDVTDFFKSKGIL